MAEQELNIYQRLLRTQAELVAPRQAGGRFGKARSAEQILEAAKPVCRKHGLYLYTTDAIGDRNGRSYVIATATVVNVDKPDETHSADANAWEGDISRGLDAPQVTGAASSYAKKYALQNLFAIDDTKDPDSSEYGNESSPVPDSTPKFELATKTQKATITALLRGAHIDDQNFPAVVKFNYGFDLTTLSKSEAASLIEEIRANPPKVES